MATGCSDTIAGCLAANKPEGRDLFVALFSHGKRLTSDGIEEQRDYDR